MSSKISVLGGVKISILGVKKMIFICLIILLSSCENNNLFNTEEKPVEENIIEKKSEILNVDKYKFTDKKENLNNQNLISKYYMNIEKGNIKIAYLMKYKPNISFKEFKKMYDFSNSGFTRISTYNFKEIGKNKLNFRVEILEETQGVGIYSVSMEIINGTNLKTLNVKKINKEILEELKVGDYRFYVKRDNEGTTLYLDKLGEKSIIKEIKLKRDGTYGVIEASGSIGGLKFINNKEILVYKVSMRSVVSTGFYNIKNGKNIIHYSIEDYGLTKDKKYLYIYSGGGQLGPLFKIYNYPEFSLYKDFGYLVENLLDNRYSDIFTFKLGEYTYEYNIKNGKMIKK